jgi:ferric-dicitrate binding protein FerR (iron transport regulator)
VSDRDGQVEIACPPDLNKWEILKMNTIIYKHCHIKTGEESTVDLSFSDMTTFKMRPETEIVMTSMDDKDRIIKLLTGKVWTNVKKMVTDGTMEVHSGQAVAGIKGTTFIMEEQGGSTLLKVIEGTVDFESKATNQNISVKAGQSASADKSGLKPITAFDTEKENKLWEDKKTVASADDKANPKPNYTYIYIIAAIAVIIIISFLLLKRKKH